MNFIGYSVHAHWFRFIGRAGFAIFTSYTSSQKKIGV
jgi:hypothetical protein